MDKNIGKRTAPGKVVSRASDIDRYVGVRVRERRVMSGLSQDQMAKMIGVTYQQTHKYECGINRISAGRLYRIAKVLGVPVSYFYEGAEEIKGNGNMPERQRMCLDLARNFTKISDKRHQQALSQMARALASE